MRILVQIDKRKYLIIERSNIEKYLDDIQKSEISSIESYIHSCIVNENRRTNNIKNKLRSKIKDLYARWKIARNDDDNHHTGFYLSTKINEEIKITEQQLEQLEQL